MDVQVLTETDVRRIIQDELNQAGAKTLNRIRSGNDECVEAAQPQLVKVRIAFRYSAASAIASPSDARREYLATPELARKMAAHFAQGIAGGTYDVFLDTKPEVTPHVIGLRFEHILQIG